MHGLVHKILDLFMVLQLINFEGVRLTFPKQKRPHLSHVYPSLTCSSLHPPLTEQKALGFKFMKPCDYTTLFSVIMILPNTLLFKLNHDL